MRGCKGTVLISDLIDHVAKYPDSGVLDIHKHFPNIDIKSLGQRLNRMAERGEIIRVFMARGGRRYFPVVDRYQPFRTLHSPNYVRSIKSVFDYK